MSEQSVQQTDASSQKEQLRTVYVSNLPNNTEESDIQTMFEEFGEIEAVSILKKSNYSSTIAFVTFKSAKSVPDAIDQKNHTLYKGNELKVELAKRNKGYEPGSIPPNRQKSRNYSDYDKRSDDRYSSRYDDRYSEPYDRRYDNYSRYDDYSRRDPYPDRYDYDRRRYGAPMPPPRYDDRYMDYDRRRDPYPDYPREDRYRGQYP